MSCSECQTPHQKPAPFWVALITFVICACIIGLSIIKLKASPHIPMILAASFTALMGMVVLRRPWKDIEDGIVDSINVALVAILILMLVGLMVASWIASGTVPTLINYGLQILSPKYFLPATLISCALIATASGSSWTTAGTIGLALMGVGTGLGIPAPMTAGAVVSGAYMGDKISPMSDTTNLAPAVAGNNLFDHIRAMMWTTIPTFVLSLIIFSVMGLKFSGNPETAENIRIISETLGSTFKLGWISLIPPAIVIFGAVRKWPAIPSLIIATLVACLIAVTVQGTSFSSLMEILQAGYTSETGVKMVDELLTRGGLDHMMWTISLIVCALSFGGVMKGCGILESILYHLRGILRTPTTLVGTTLVSSFLCNFFLGDQFLGIIVPGRTFKDAYDEMGLAPRMLSRTLEDCGTLTSPLIPWTACGAYMTGVLGVGSFTYAPYAVLNYLNPLVALVMTALGIAVFWRKADGTITRNKTEAAPLRPND